MVCTNDRRFGCDHGYDYGYYYQSPHCCNFGMSAFWTIFLWCLLGLCICLCISTCFAMMRRRRMQQAMMAHNRNHHVAADRHDSSSSDEDIRRDRSRRNQPPRPVYNAPVGGMGYQQPVMYAPPAVISMDQGVRPYVDTNKTVTHVRITLFNGQ